MNENAIKNFKIENSGPPGPTPPTVYFLTTPITPLWIFNYCTSIAGGVKYDIVVAKDAKTSNFHFSKALRTLTIFNNVHL